MSWSSIKAWLASKSPLGNPVAAQIAVYTVIALLFVGMLTKCGTAHSAELDMMVGSTIVRGETGVIGMNLIFPKVVANYANISIGMDIIGQSTFCGRGSAAGNGCANDNQSIIHGQVVAPLKYNFELGIGIARIQHSDNYNSGQNNFSLSLQHPVWERKFPNVFWRYQHFSNAGTSAPNEGRDMLLIGWRFK